MFRFAGRDLTPSDIVIPIAFNAMQAMQWKLHNHPREFSFHLKPQILINNEDKALSAKVMHYILDVLKVNVKLVSPHTHGSLKTERYINNLITRQLSGKGRDLQMSSLYDIKWYHPHPLELVFLTKAL